MMALLKRPHLDKLTSIEQDVQAAMFSHPELFKEQIKLQP